MLDPKTLKKNIISDLRVELTDEFDRNFERKAFFGNRWKHRRTEGRGTLLLVTGTLRRSIRSSVVGDGVRFTSQVPYATVHNEGGTIAQNVRAHQRRRHGKTHDVRAHQRRINMPQRQFIGDGPDTRRIIKSVIDDNLQQYNNELTKALRQ